MGSIHDWLAFSLSPHLAGVDMQGETCHALNAAAAAAAYELPSNTSHYLSAPEAQGSLCILEAFNRGAWTNRSATEIKPDTQAQADSEPAQQQQHQLINADFSALQGSNSSDLTSDSTTININIRQRPKLENFLGDAEVQHQQQQENPAAQHHHHQMFFSNGEALQVQSLCMSESSDSSKQPEQHQQESMAMAADFYSLQHLPQSSVYNMYGMSPAAGVFKTWLPSQSSSSEDSVVPSAAGSAPMAVPIQPLSLSVSGSSESKCSPSAATSAAIVAVSQNSPQENPSSGVSTHNNQSPVAPLESTPRKSIDTFGQRTSIYRGVTKHRWTGRYEAHLWDNSCRREGQTRKGRQVYLGGYDKEEKAARAYDLAALKYWGPSTTTNFAISTYEKELEEMKHMTRQEFVASLRRKSSGFSRGASIYRGVTRHHQHGRWQARIGRVAGNKDLYLGTFSTQEEAAEAYDIAAIKFRGLNAVTNFDISRYDVKSIANSALPIGGIAKRLKDAEPAVKRMIATADTITAAAAVAAATHNQQQQSNCKTHHHDQEWVSLANPLSMAATTSLSWLKNQSDLYNNSSHIHHHTATASNLHNNSTALLFGDSASVAEASKSTYDNILYYLSQQQQQQQSQSHTRQVAAEYEALSWLPSTTVMATSSAAHQAARAANLPPLFSIWNES